MSWTHVEARGVHALNETTFLVTYSSDILADEIGSAIEKINEWFFKPVVITCDEVNYYSTPSSDRTKYPVYHVLLALNRKRTLSGLNSGFMLYQMLERISMSN